MCFSIGSVTKNEGTQIMPEQQLPAAFTDLEPFMAWSLATEPERQKKRMSSSMAEIQTFYDAILPRMDAVISYLDQFPLNAMPADAQRLLHLTFSLAEVAAAVELFKQPGVADGYDAARFVPTHNR
jgi:gamma-glutamylcysteine synthetase